MPLMSMKTIQSKWREKTKFISISVTKSNLFPIEQNGQNIIDFPFQQQQLVAIPISKSTWSFVAFINNSYNVKLMVLMVFFLCFNFFMVSCFFMTYPFEWSRIWKLEWFYENKQTFFFFGKVIDNSTLRRTNAGEKWNIKDTSTKLKMWMVAIFQIDSVIYFGCC